MKKKLSLIVLAAFCAVMAFAEPEPGSKIPYQPPKLSHPDSWTMVVVPDVQAYTERACNNGILDIMNTWIVSNLAPLRIRQVLFTGDLVFRNDQRNLTPTVDSYLGQEQWKAFSRLMERLDGRVSYILCTGNHDYGHRNAESRRTWFNDYFPTDRNPVSRKYLQECNYNAFGTTTLENAVYEFTAPAPDDRKFLIFTLQFAPTDADLKWAKKIADLPRFANHIGILLTHSYLRWTGERIQSENYVLNREGGNAGEAIFRKFVYPAKNIRLVICGHICNKPDVWEHGVAFSVDRNASGKTVAQMAFNTHYMGGGAHGNGETVGCGCWNSCPTARPSKPRPSRRFSPSLPPPGTWRGGTTSAANSPSPSSKG